MDEINWGETLGLLSDLYHDDTVTEIMVDGPQRVTVERNGRLEGTGLKFASSAALTAVIDSVLGAVGVQRKPGQTIGEGRFADGTRVMAVLPPTAVEGPSLIIRKMVSNRITWDLLFEYGALDQDTRDLFHAAVLGHKNILISGGMGSGKTTVANRVVELVPPEERMVVVEAERTMQIEHPQRVYLEAGGSANISMDELILAASKMRPDWVIIGELLGAEAMTALEILGRGHAGMATMHATSPEDALLRLEAMCLMTNKGLGLGEIRLLIASAIQVLAYQEKMPDGCRRMRQLVELCGLENERYVLQPLMRYNALSGSFELLGKPSWI